MKTTLAFRLTIISLVALSLDAAAIEQPAASAPVAVAQVKNNLPAGVLAIVNGVPVSQDQLEAALRTARQPDTPQTRQLLKQELIARELFRQQAEKQHYDAKPEVKEAIAQAKVNAETQLYLKDSIHAEPVTDTQVKARYDEIVASLGKEEYKPRIIAVADDTTATTVLAQLKSGATFDALARQYSVAPSKAAGGELPWVSFRMPVAQGQTQGLPLPVAQALIQLPVGGVTPSAIPAGESRVIVKLDAKRPTQVPGFDQAKDTIRQQLQALALQKAAAQFVGGLMKGASIQQ